MFSMFKSKSRAQRVQERLEKCLEPSALAVTVTGRITSSQHNKWMKFAVNEYNQEHSKKVFSE
jgi:hypothetical protein